MKKKKTKQLKLWLNCKTVKLTISVGTQTHWWLITRHHPYQCTGCREVGQNTTKVTNNCVTVSSNGAALFLSLPELSLIPSDSRDQPETRIDKISQMWNGFAAQPLLPNLHFSTSKVPFYFAWSCNVVLIYSWMVSRQNWLLSNKFMKGDHFCQEMLNVYS